MATLTCCQQLAALQRVAEIAGALVLEVPRGPEWQQTYVQRKRIREIEEALTAAGYDMTAVRERYKQLKKEAAR